MMKSLDPDGVRITILLNMLLRSTEIKTPYVALLCLFPIDVMTDVEEALSLVTKVELFNILLSG